MVEWMLKDLRLHKKFILGFGVAGMVYLGFFMSRANNPGVVSVFGAFLYSILPLLIFTREDKFKAAAFNLSLPGTRKEFLLARYLSGWLLMLSLYAGTSLLTIILPGTKLGPSTVFQARTVLTVLAFMAILFAALIPLIVAFGWTGLIAMLVFFQVLGIVFMLLVTTFRPELRAVIDRIGRAAGAAQSVIGPAGFATALVAFLLLLNFVSFRVSVHLFERKEF
jgi:fatty acid desaturase